MKSKWVSSKSLVFFMVVGYFLGSLEGIPNYQACTTPASQSYAYCNTSLSFEARIASLLSTLTLDEKISLISPDDAYDTCPVVVSGVARLDLPRYMWLIETNTGVSSACYGPERCATTFIGPEGLGATFNRTLWFAKVMSNCKIK